MSKHYGELFAGLCSKPGRLSAYQCPPGLRVWASLAAIVCALPFCVLALPHLSHPLTGNVILDWRRDLVGAIIAMPVGLAAGFITLVWFRRGR